MNGDRRASSCEDIFTARTWEHAANAPLFYNFAARSTGDDSMTNGLCAHIGNNIRGVRGKIVLLYRFEGSQDVGPDLTYWPLMDYFEKPPESVSNMIKMNQK
jgi:hypothetical protein